MDFGNKYLTIISKNYKTITYYKSEDFYLISSLIDYY